MSSLTSLDWCYIPSCAIEAGICTESLRTPTFDRHRIDKLNAVVECLDTWLETSYHCEAMAQARRFCIDTTYSPVDIDVKSYYDKVLAVFRKHGIMEREHVIPRRYHKRPKYRVYYLCPLSFLVVATVTATSKREGSEWIDEKIFSCVIDTISND